MGGTGPPMKPLLPLLLLAAPALAQGSASIDVASLELAIANAEDGAVLELGPGTYLGPLVVGGKELWLQAASRQAEVVLVGVPGEPVVSVVDGGTLHLRGITVRGGRAPRGAGVFVGPASNLEVIGGRLEGNVASEAGGALWVDAGHARLEGVVVAGNASAGDGGAVWCGPTSALEVLGCEVIANEAQGDGGGVHARADDVLLAGGSFTGNVAASGGAAFLGGAYAVVRDAAFEGNMAQSLFGGGGALALEGVDARVEACAFEENGFREEELFGEPLVVAGWSGGAVRSTADRCQVLDSTFLANRVVGEGAALWSSGDDAAVRGSAFLSNSSGPGRGGGMYASGAGLVLAGSTFEDNAADFWGACDAIGGAARVEDCRFTGNSNGALRVDGTSSVADCRFVDNESDYWEPALLMDVGSGGSIARCELLDNRVRHGAAGLRVRGASAVVRDTVVAGNTSLLSPLNGDGAGVDLVGAVVAIERCTLVDNRLGVLTDPSTSGAGLHLGPGCGPCSLVDSVVWANAGASGSSAQIVDLAGTLAVRTSDVEGGWPGIGNLDVDPAFVDAASGDYGLSGASPLIDAGSEPSGPTGADLRDTPRALDGDLDGVLRYDLGALERARITLDPGPTPLAWGALDLAVSADTDLIGLLLIGLQPGVASLPPLGDLLVDPLSIWAAVGGWVPLPSLYAFDVPDALAGETLHLQVVGLAPGLGAGTLSPLLRIPVAGP